MTHDPDETSEEYNYSTRLEEAERDYAKEQMKQKHPGYSEGAYNAGLFLGVNFPYVPGDPDF